jgi:hypothetical protein
MLSRLDNARRDHLERLLVERDYSRLLKIKLEVCFPSETLRLKARRALELYGSNSNEPEADRVRLAILKLSGADFQEIQSIVRGAKEDYQNIINWAEEPALVEFPHLNKGRPANSEERKKIEGRDLLQYENWLRAGF